MAVLKPHIALNTTNLEAMVNFYQTFFGVAPIKYKSDYAKFDLSEPPLNLTLELEPNLNSGGSLSHLGIQVDSSAEVRTAVQRFRAANLPILEEQDTECCYALLDKVWISDPDGNRWEVFTVKVEDTAPEQNISPKGNKETAAKASPCCA